MGIPTVGLKKHSESGWDYSARFFLGMVINIDAITNDASGATARGSTVVEIAHIAMKPLIAFTVAAIQSFALPRR